MKKKSKIIFKEFGSSFGRFIAIAGIIMLGVAFLIGLTVSTPDIKYSFNEYFIQNNLQDFSLRSETGFSSGDVKIIEECDEIKDVQALFSYDAMVNVDGKQKSARFYITDDAPTVNKTVLTDGKNLSYEEANKIVAVEPFGNMENYTLGKKVTVTEDYRKMTVDMGNFSIPVTLFDTYEFEIVGTVRSPLYFSYVDETCTIGDGKVDYIFFADSSLLSSMIKNLGMTTEIWVTADDTAKYTAFTEDYDDYATKVKNNLTDIKKDGWYILDRSTNLSYYSLSINADKVANIATVFPIFFIAVAALVAFSTIVRMVDEDRSQIGALRSLGFSGASIASKYIAYALTACILGLIVAVPLGLTILPVVIWKAYGSMYVLPAFHLTADFVMIAVSAVVAIISTLIVTIFACASSLKETPASILQPRAPKPGKRILLERIPLWGLLPFKYKASLRNIFRFKRNLIMTVLAVAGCSALIVAGFGMLNSVSAVTDLQFNQIYSYDLTLGVTANYAESEEMTDFLSGKDYVEVRKERGSLSTDKRKENANIVTGDANLTNYIDIGDFDGNDVKISKGVADALGLGVGDKINVTNASDVTVSFEITDVVTIYSESWVFIGKDIYAQTDKFGDASFNSLLVQSNIDEADQPTATEDLFKIKCVNGVTFTSTEKVMFDNMGQTISLIVVVLIVCAGALVIIVLYNLTNINIGERKKEIATLKVLGYRMGEVAGYVFREIFILVLLGILCGFGLGFGLLNFVLFSINSPSLTFPILIQWWSFFVSAGATLIFSALVDLILLPKLKKIDMADSMKAVD